MCWKRTSDCSHINTSRYSPYRTDKVTVVQFYLNPMGSLWVYVLHSLLFMFIIKQRSISTTRTTSTLLKAGRKIHCYPIAFETSLYWNVGNRGNGAHCSSSKIRNNNAYKKLLLNNEPSSIPINTLPQMVK